MTPVESDETLEPVDISEIDQERLLFYLAGRVPVPIQELAEETNQPAAELREYFYEELQTEVDIDSTGFVRLMDSARNPVIRVSKSYIKSGQCLFETGQSSNDQSFFKEAIDHFRRAIRIFEQIQSRLEAVNYSSEKLDQRLETARSSIEEAQEAIGDSADRVATLHYDNRSDADSNASPESSISDSGSDDREKMLELVKELYTQLGRVPKTTELPEECEYSPNDFYSEFGSWDEALEAGGVDKEQSMLDEIERVAEKLVQVPSTVDMQEHGVYSSYSSYFGSWSEALERADVKQKFDSGSSSDDREAMLEVVRELNKQLGRAPKTTELPEECEYSPNDFYNKFGNWDGALEAAGIEKEQDMLDEIERVAEKLGRVPNSTDMDDHGAYSGSRYSTYFDSWSVALERSCVEENREKKLLERLRSIHDDLDRIPKTTDLHDVSGISQHDYIQNYGSWDEALEAAGIDKEQYLIDDLKKVAAKVDGKPGTTAANRFGEYSAKIHQNYFGSWDAALEAADLSSIDPSTVKERETEGESSGTATLGPSAPIAKIRSHVDRFDLRSVSQLKKVGYTTLGDLCNAEPSELAKYKEIGHAEANELVGFATANVSKYQNSPTEKSEIRAPDSNSSERANVESRKVDGSATLDPATSVDDIEDIIDGVGRSSVRAVKKAGYNTLGELHHAKPEEITKYESVGMVKALKLIRFAMENVSTNNASSEQSSTQRQSAGQPDSSTQGTSSDRIHPSALDTSWETIPANERIDGQFLLQVRDVAQQAGKWKTTRLNVRDKNGQQFRIEIWPRHQTDGVWRENEWYALENARGKVWESSDGTTRKKLSSTKDINVVELGADFDPNAVSEAQQPGSTTADDGCGSTPNSTAPGEATAATIDDGGSGEDECHEVDDDRVKDNSYLEDPTKQELIEAYRKVAQKLGQRPRKDQFVRGTEYSEAAILAVFSDWEHAYNDVFNEVDIRTKTNTKQQDTTIDQSTSTQRTGTPTKDQLKAEIEAIAEDIGKRPSTEEFDEQSEAFTTDEVYDAFGSWRTATSAASFDQITREALLEDIHRLVEKLQYTPQKSHIEEHGRFKPYDYQDEFGSVGEAVTEAGYHLKPSVKAALENVAQRVGGRPSTTEFNEHSPYNQGVVYKVYDSWGAAIFDIKVPGTTASNDTSSGQDSNPTKTTVRSSGPEPAPNELAERYETIRNLNQLLLAIEDLILDTHGSVQSGDPMQEWLNEVQSLSSELAYREQQRERNDFTIDEYREAHGDGDHVLEFQTIDAEPPSQAMQALLNPHYDGDVSNLYLPTNKETGRRFPVLVESNAGLEDARAMLESLPATPPATGSKSTSITIPEADLEAESKSSTKEPAGTSTATSESASGTTGQARDAEATSDGLEELLQIPVLTEEMAKALQKAGYDGRAALAEASDGEIGDVDGISEQIAMRIVLAVTTD